MRSPLKAALVHLALLTWFLPTTLHAAPVPYKLDTAQSEVAFSYIFEGAETRGNFPDFSANVALDLMRLENSSIDVTLKTKTAKGGFVFATQALRGAKMLDSQRFPDISFKSKRLTRSGDQAKLIGDITVKGITRPLTLDARLFRTTGSDPDDLDNLIVKLTGEIDRAAFGVDGFKTFVGNILQISITANITKL